MYNSKFKNISSFFIKGWTIKGFSTPSDWQYDNNIHLELEDKERISKKLLLYQLGNKELKQLFTKIETEITIFKSWKEYNTHIKK